MLRKFLDLNRSVAALRSAGDGFIRPPLVSNALGTQHLSSGGECVDGNDLIQVQL
jgi:GT2 family glycosyltransferase